MAGGSPAELQEKIDGLEARINAMGPDAETRDLLGAVAELREVRAQYSSSVAARAAEDEERPRWATEEGERWEEEDAGMMRTRLPGLEEEVLEEEVLEVSAAARQSAPVVEVSAAWALEESRPMSAGRRRREPPRSHPRESYGSPVDDERRNFVSTAPVSRRRFDDDAAAPHRRGDFVAMTGGYALDSDDESPRPRSASRTRPASSGAGRRLGASSSSTTTGPFVDLELRASLEARGSGRGGHQGRAVSSTENFGVESKRRAQPTSRDNFLSRTTPAPFTNLEADIRARQRRSYEMDMTKVREEEEARKREEEAYQRLLRIPPGTGFKGVEARQAAQDRRSAARRAEARAAEACERDAHRFRATAPPEDVVHGASLADRQAMEEVDRGARIQRRAERAMLSSTAPNVARTHVNSTGSLKLDLTLEEDKEKAQRKKKVPEPEEVTRQNDLAHERWLKSLERCKQQGRSCTEPKDPLEARRLASQQRTADRARARREREEAEALELKRRAQVRRERAQKASRPTDKTARQTYSSYLKAQAVREKQRADRELAAQEAQVAQERALRQRRVSKKLSDELRETDVERADRLKESAAPDPKAEQRRFKQALKANKARLANVAKDAPSLISRLNIQTAKDKARVEALKRVSQTVYGSTKPADWKHVVAGADIFDDEDKVFLNIAAAADGGDDYFDDE